LQRVSGLLGHRPHRATQIASWSLVFVSQAWIWNSSVNGLFDDYVKWSWLSRNFGISECPSMHTFQCSALIPFYSLTELQSVDSKYAFLLLLHFPLQAPAGMEYGYNIPIGQADGRAGELTDWRLHACIRECAPTQCSHADTADMHGASRCPDEGGGRVWETANLSPICQRNDLENHVLVLFYSRKGREHWQ
jgi:hypothetical protein